MISIKILIEYCDSKCSFKSMAIDLLPKLYRRRSVKAFSDQNHFNNMAGDLQATIQALTLEDDEPINLPDIPRFKVFDESAISILGRLVNPDCQQMSRMIEDMPRVWRMTGRVRSREKFQFILQREEDLQAVLFDRPWSFNHWTMLMEKWTPSPPEYFLTSV